MSSLTLPRYNLLTTCISGANLKGNPQAAAPSYFLQRQGWAPLFLQRHVTWRLTVCSGITGGGVRGRVPPRDIWQGNFCWPTRKKRQRKRKGKGVKIEKKRRKIVKRKVEIESGRWKSFKSYKMRRGFFFFCFSLFKTTKICLGSTKMEIFYREKAFHARKKSGKMTLPPQKNFPVTPLTVRGCLGATAFLLKSAAHSNWKFLDPPFIFPISEFCRLKIKTGEKITQKKVIRKC